MGTNVYDIREGARCIKESITSFNDPSYRVAPPIKSATSGSMPEVVVTVGLSIPHLSMG